MLLTINQETARRYILGKQGLWPGRRWQGVQGTIQAMHSMEYLQLDPLQIIARSQDIMLYGRVCDYTPSLWEIVTYEQRKFFDWGGWLAVRPMDELPHWRVVMQRERDGEPRIRKTAKEHAGAIAEMLEVLKGRVTVSNRDFKMPTRTRTDDYRGRKDSAVALHYLWRTGKVMTHHRENFERVYALTENVAPAHLIYESDDDITNRFLIKKEISFSGLSRLNRASDSFLRGVPFGTMQHLIDDMRAKGDIIEVQVEGWKATHCALGSDAELLSELSAGRVPAVWAPLDTTTMHEAVFIAPLDQVSARGRAKVVFNFDYVWEVYKPADKRRYGYYTLPVLWGDKLVARFDSKLDRSTNTFIILGLWLEDEMLGKNAAFATALSRGFARFVAFLGAEKLDTSAVNEPLLRKQIGA